VPLRSGLTEACRPAVVVIRTAQYSKLTDLHQSREQPLSCSVVDVSIPLLSLAVKVRYPSFGGGIYSWKSNDDRQPSVITVPDKIMLFTLLNL